MYEVARSTRLVATLCACCARPLRDAVSVEAGMGPMCRETHGYAAPDLSADWNAVHTALSGHFAALNLPDDWDSSPRRAANLLVHRVAVEQEGEIAVACVNALLALGFAKLSRRIAVRLAKIVLSDEGTFFAVKAPYHEGLFVIPGRRWDPETKTHRVEAPTEIRARDGLKDRIYYALADAFPGALAWGPKGLFVLTP